MLKLLILIALFTEIAGNPIYLDCSENVGVVAKKPSITTCHSADLYDLDIPRQEIEVTFWSYPNRGHKSIQIAKCRKHTIKWVTKENAVGGSQNIQEFNTKTPTRRECEEAAYSTSRPVIRTDSDYLKDGVTVTEWIEKTELYGEMIDEYLLVIPDSGHKTAIAKKELEVNDCLYIWGENNKECELIKTSKEKCYVYKQDDYWKIVCSLSARTVYLDAGNDKKVCEKEKIRRTTSGSLISLEPISDNSYSYEASNNKDTIEHIKVLENVLSEKLVGIENYMKCRQKSQLLSNWKQCKYDHYDTKLMYNTDSAIVQWCNSTHALLLQCAKKEASKFEVIEGKLIVDGKHYSDEKFTTADKPVDYREIGEWHFLNGYVGADGVFYQGRMRNNPYFMMEHLSFAKIEEDLVTKATDPSLISSVITKTGNLKDKIVIVYNKLIEVWNAITNFIKVCIITVVSVAVVVTLLWCFKKPIKKTVRQRPGVYYETVETTKTMDKYY